MMNKSIFKPENFFEFQHSGCREIFNNVVFVWEVVPKIAGLLAIKFKKNSFKANYKNLRNIFVDQGTLIHPAAEILGPAIIGRNCTIGPHAYLRENCFLGDNVHIGHAVEIKNSILLDGAIIAHLNYIGDSIVGQNVNIAGGTILTNLRLDRRPVRVQWGSKKIETGLTKLGSIIGDDSFIGANVVLNPGTILGKKSMVYPLASVRGIHYGDTIIKK